MIWKILLSVLFIATIIHHTAFAQEKRGGMILSFDDGYPSWLIILAPEVAKVGGVITGYVNNQRVHFGDLSYEDLRTLQNKYRWEIGTHTYHHFNAPAYIERKRLSLWVTEELDASVNELQSQGLKIQTMVFPYNAFTKELAAEVMKKFVCFRRNETFPIAESIGRDGSIPGTEFDFAFYVPLEQILRWIDYAHHQKKFLFLYGHKVLPDEDFFTGKVATVTAQKLVSKENIEIPTKRDLCIVPDIRRRVYRPVKVESITGNAIAIYQGNLPDMTEIDATFIVGPCYGMQLSYFRKVISYAAERMPFYTIHEAVNKMREPSIK